MNKKSLLKKMSIVVASAAMMVTALPLTASAYTGFVNGSYPVNANLYVPKAETPLRQFNAYFTSKEMPPKNAVITNNATLKVQDDGLYLTIPVENSGLNLKTIGTTPSGLQFVTGKQSSIVCDSHSGDRYTSVTFKMTPDDVDENYTYTIANCASHAKIQKTILGGLTITATDKELNTNVVLTVNIPDEAMNQ